MGVPPPLRSPFRPPFQSERDLAADGWESGRGRGARTRRPSSVDQQSWPVTPRLPSDSYGRSEELR